LVNILGGSQYLKTINYYDAKARLIQSFAQNHLGGIDRIDSQYDFTNELINSTRIHTSASDNVTIANRYEYDHMGRKLRTYQKTGPSGTSNPEVMLSELLYNDIGQLIKKRLHNTSPTSGSYPLDITLDDGRVVASGQEVHITASNSVTLLPGFHADAGSIFTANIQNNALLDIQYTYNSRGWLKTITSPQFSMQLKYEDGTSPQYNGNIANQLWGVAAPDVNTFTYSYDKLNRLTNGSASGMSEALTYDAMGNIITMNRDGTALGTYQYDGSRLKQISGGSLPTTLYQYDQNGNATAVRNNIAITYNLLNLPQTVSGGLSYTYDAIGQKLKKQTAVATTDYVNGIQYNNGTIDFVQTEEGIARKSGTNYSYQYNLTDHLGNVRATFYQNPATQVLEVIQKDDYYPFGSRKSASLGTNKYLYNGKELQDELGGQYDYGARFYDPMIGRWTSVDPLGEKYRRWSPYNYGVDNPIRFIDPDGMKPTPAEAAAMAQNAYKVKNGNKGLLNGWHRSDAIKGIKYNDDETGLNSALYERTDQKTGKTEYVYATAGTDPASLSDLNADVAQLLGVSAQYTQANLNAKFINQKLKNSELTFVGHSLGGGEAAANAEATGRSAITFNAAGLSNATKSNLGITHATDMKIDNYEVEGQVLDVQRVVGLAPEGIQHHIGSESISSQYINGQIPVAGFIQSIVNHLMDTVTPSLK